jgi:hypothetical protein
LENNMPIYLRHPTHGTKVASIDMEAQYDEQHGWTRFDPTEDAVAEPADNAIVKTRKRRTATVEE